ncbi:MAG TPA: NAD(P)H-hydrate dehydratase [Gammaproteobacteria bacterium]|jgi:NAD(P)H-hydrate epimerase|nr:NAD(P)H-hydrate dehydratase [Gammaproteobacteria bacterium]
MAGTKVPVYQTEQIREFERLAAERFNISGDVLMARAAKAALDFMLRRFANAKRVAVFCGSGNNGGDGYVLAELAQERGLLVTVYQVGDHGHLKNEAKHAHDRCIQAKISILKFQDKIDLQHPDLIVDAICGIGVHEALRDDVVLALDNIRRTQIPVFALDAPTGIDADTGCVLGAALKAAATITFIGYKLGLLTGSGSSYTGELVLNDLQLPPDLFAYVEPVAEKIQLSTFNNYLKARLRDWHKGLSGHVLVIGGAQGFSGAPRLAGMAALRVGAGLVTIATDPVNAAAMNAECPELMCHGVANVEDLQPLLSKADVIVLGPGLSQSDWALALWQEAIKQDAWMVIDADALNLLANHPQTHENWVLTPHPGEAARLLGQTSQVIQSERLESVKDLAKRYGGVAVLKGAGTLVVAPNMLPGVCDKGNPGMASAGMGDILSGVIGGLLSQGIPPGEAARLGVVMHATAGDMAAKDGERGMIATDLLPYLRRLSNITS